MASQPAKEASEAIREARRAKARIQRRLRAELGPMPRNPFESQRMKQRKDMR